MLFNVCILFFNVCILLFNVAVFLLNISLNQGEEPKKTIKKLKKRKKSANKAVKSKEYEILRQEMANIEKFDGTPFGQREIK